MKFLNLTFNVIKFKLDFFVFKSKFKLDFILMLLLLKLH